MITLEEKQKARELLRDVSAAMTEELYRADESPTMIHLTKRSGDMRVRIIVEKDSK